MQRRRVLIVDDHAGIRRGVARALVRFDVEVVVAASCAEAREHAGAIDIAIVDYNLGDGFGDLLARELLVSTRLRAVVFHTATMDARVLERLATIGSLVHKIDHGLPALRRVVAELTG
ncbi:MAG: response regulator [Polyangiales bacterium]